MELRLLRYFVAVAEELHLARAADRLGIDQSPLSRAMRDLEQGLGVALFDRSSRQTRLTWAGQVLLVECRRVLATLDQAIQATKGAAQGYQSYLRIAICDSLAQPRIAALLARNREEEPELEIRIFELPLSQQLKGLHTDLLDVGFALSGSVNGGLAWIFHESCQTPAFEGIGGLMRWLARWNYLNIGVLRCPGRSTPLPPLVCQRAGDSTGRGLWSHRARGREEHVLQGMLRRQQQPDSTGVAQHRSADLQQLGSDRGRAGMLQLGVLQGQAPEIDHQRVGQGSQQQAQLVGREQPAARPAAEQIKLRFLDAVFGLAARAIQLLVQRRSVALQTGDHEARIGPKRTMLQAGDHAALALPVARGVLQLADHALLRTGCGVLLGNDLRGQRRQPLQRRILLHPDDVVDAPGVQAAQHLGPTEA